MAAGPVGFDEHVVVMRLKLYGSIMGLHRIGLYGNVYILNLEWVDRMLQSEKCKRVALAIHLHLIMVDLDTWPCTCSDHARHSHDGAMHDSSSVPIPKPRRASAPSSPSDEIASAPLPLPESPSRCESRHNDHIVEAKAAYADSDSVASIPDSSREDATGEARSWRSVFSQLHRVPRKSGALAARHMRFVGPGLVSSVAYFDP